MTHRLPVLLALLAAAVPAAAQDRGRPPGPPPAGTVGQWTQWSIRERIVIRIPRVRRSAAEPPAEAPIVGWAEKRGDRCVPAAGIAGALVPGPGRVDLLMDDGGRARALLETDCPALDYYLGFYIRPTVDGKVCAGRDSIRSRSGAACPIRSFRRLVPQR